MSTDCPDFQVYEFVQPHDGDNTVRMALWWRGDHYQTAVRYERSDGSSNEDLIDIKRDLDDDRVWDLFVSGIEVVQTLAPSVMSVVGEPVVLGEPIQRTYLELERR